MRGTVSMIVAANINFEGAQDVSFEALFKQQGEHQWLVGRDNGLPWNIPRDLAHFKRVTSRPAVAAMLMGRHTYEGIGALPGRITVVITRKPSLLAPKMSVAFATSLDAGIRMGQSLGEKSALEVIICGGPITYAQALEQQHVDKIYLTLIRGGQFEGNVFMKPIKAAEWRITAKKIAKRHPRARAEFCFFELERTRSQRGRHT